ISFNDLRIDTAGAGKQLSVSAGGLSSGSSATFTVNPSAATSLAIQTQPPATTTAGASFSPAPVVRLLDSFGNLVTTDSSTVVTATRNAATARSRARSPQLRRVASPPSRTCLTASRRTSLLFSRAAV